jgi:hypothetical protein
VGSISWKLSSEEPGREGRVSVDKYSATQQVHAGLATPTIISVALLVRADLEVGKELSSEEGGFIGR